MEDLGKINLRIKNLLKIQAYYYGKGNHKRCSELERQIAGLMKQRDNLMEEAYASEDTVTDWYYNQHEEGEASVIGI